MPSTSSSSIIQSSARVGAVSHPLEEEFSHPLPTSASASSPPRRSNSSEESVIANAGPSSFPPRPEEWAENDQRWRLMAKAIKKGIITPDLSVTELEKELVDNIPPPLDIKLPMWFMKRRPNCFHGTRYHTKEQLDAALERNAKRWRNIMKMFEPGGDLKQSFGLPHSPPPTDMKVPRSILLLFGGEHGIEYNVPLDWNWKPSK